MSKETWIRKVRRFNETIEDGVSVDLSWIGKTVLFFDFMNEYLFHGAYLLDYIQYGFYWKKNRERRKYIVHGKLLEIMRRCNNPEHRYIFDHKPEFDRVFSDFLQREYLDTSVASEEEFRVFLQGKEHFFVKEPDGMFGTGVRKVFTEEIKDVAKSFSEYKNKNYLCEESLTQCIEMEEFNDSSINTVRIVTVRTKDGDVRLVGGFLRLGREGRIADNFHHMGIAAFLDTELGVITSTGVDKTYTRYAVHPDSGKQIVGFRIPEWEQIVKTVTRAAQVVPDVRYVGWDVVITKDYRIAIVEGNPGADPDAEQITGGEGRWPVYREMIKGL